MLELINVHLRYGGVHALKGVSLKVSQNEIVALVGSNGAGKSTLLRAISGLASTLSGTMAFDGQSIERLPSQRIAGRGIAHVPEGRRIFAELSVEDNLLVGAHLLRERTTVSQELQRVYAMFPQLARYRRRPGGRLSGGEQQMLAIGRALMSRPRLLLLDEPSLGLAPKVIEEVATVIRRSRDGGLTVLLVEQNANLALRLSDRAYVIERGSITLMGPACELARNPDVQASYLGGHAVAPPSPVAAAMS